MYSAVYTNINKIRKIVNLKTPDGQLTSHIFRLFLVLIVQEEVRSLGGAVGSQV